MRVAYCLSGFLRNYKNNNFFENMVSQVPGDVFIHTWNELIPGTKLDINEAVSYYNPKGIIVEDQATYKNNLELYKHEEFLQNYVCMWRSISSSINLAKDYDVIIRFRPDLLVTSVFNSEEVYKAFESKNHLYLGLSDDCFWAKILTDNFAFGSELVMKTYANHYSSAIACRSAYSSNERSITAYLHDYRYMLQFKHSDLRYNIKRMDNFIVPNSQTISSLSENWI